MDDDERKPRGAPEASAPEPEATARAAAAASRPEVARAVALLGRVVGTMPAAAGEPTPLAAPAPSEDPILTAEPIAASEEEVLAPPQEEPVDASEEDVPAASQEAGVASEDVPAPAEDPAPPRPALPLALPGPPAAAPAPSGLAPQQPLSPVWSAVLLAAIVAFMVAVGLAGRLPAGPAWLVEIALLAAAMGVVGLATTGKVFGTLVDAQKLVSLSRFQAVVWTIVVLSAYFLVVLRRMNGPDPMAVAIDERLWALMGISAASLMGTPLLQNRKRRVAPQPGVTQATASALGQPVEEVERYGSGILYANPSIDDARFTDMFSGEEVGNAQYVDLNEAQMFFVTVLVAVLYAVSLYRLLDGTPAAGIASLPSLPAGLTAVLGLSYTANLGGRLVRHTPVRTDARTGPVGPTEAERMLRAILEGAQRSIEVATSIDGAAAAQARSARQLVQVTSDLVDQSKRRESRTGRDLGGTLAQIADALQRVHAAQQEHARGAQYLLHAARRIEEAAQAQDQASRRLLKGTERGRRAGA